MIKVFVIALKESPRKAKIKADLDALNIAFEFVDAVDAREGLPPQYEKRVNRTLAKKRISRPILDVELGCAISHALVYEKIVAEKIAHSIILEDDAIVGENFASFIKKDLLPNAPFDMGILYYGFCCVMGKKQRLGDYPYYKVAFMPVVAVGYYLNLKVAKTLKTATEIISHYADYPIAINQKYRVVVFFPRLVHHPKVTKSQSLVTQKVEKIKHKYKKLTKVKIYLKTKFCYTANKAYHGSFWGFLKRRYFWRFYKNISPNW